MYILDIIFNRKTEKQELRESVISLSERLCFAQQLIRDREYYLVKTTKEAIGLVGVFSPEKMMEFYENHRQIDEPIKTIW